MYHISLMDSFYQKSIYLLAQTKSRSTYGGDTVIIQSIWNDSQREDSIYQIEDVPGPLIQTLKSKKSRRRRKKEPDDFDEIIGDDGLPIRTQGCGAFSNDDQLFQLRRHNRQIPFESCDSVRWWIERRRLSLSWCIHGKYLGRDWSVIFAPPLKLSFLSA